MYRTGDRGMLGVMSETPHSRPRSGSDALRTVLVAGCTGGFGFRAARECARRGHRVVAGVRDPDDHNADVADEISALAHNEGLALWPVRLDVDDDDSVRSAVELAISHTGGLDCVVNAAAYSVMGPLEACPPEQLRRMLETNVVGALRLVRATVPLMRAAGRGRIIQITSGLGRAAVPFMGVYSAGAWAQECFAEVLSYELAPFGIDVAILEPSGYRDEFGGPSLKAVGDADRVAVYQEPLIRFAEIARAAPAEDDDPEEVARAIADTVEAERVPLRLPVGAAAESLRRMREEKSAAEYEREIMARTGLGAFVRSK